MVLQYFYDIFNYRKFQLKFLVIETAFTPHGEIKTENCQFSWF